MLNHRGQGNVEGGCQTGDRKGSFAELVQYGAARGIAQSVKDTVDVNSRTRHYSCRLVWNGPARRFLMVAAR
jgi:hypothetical protein